MASIPIFGRRVTLIREERGLTQQELATKAGTSYQTIWRIENGKHAEPGIYIARGIARARLGGGDDRHLRRPADRGRDRRADRHTVRG